MFGGNKFEILGIDENLSETCNKIGWNEPTEIQRKVIPLMIKGNDVIALAETGSGKTGAFALPIIQKLFVKPKYNFALILTPTHELAIQIKNEFLKLGEDDGLKVVTLIGGEFVEDQVKLLKSTKFHIVIGTPGRVVEHITKTKLLNFKSLRFLILDEADRMLSDDFGTDLETIVSALPREHQTCLFSATMTNKLEKLETVCLKNPLRVEVSRKHQTVAKLTQEMGLMRNEEEKLVFLVWKLQNMCSNSAVSGELSSAIVFTNTRKESKMVYGVLEQFDISVAMLQSEMNRVERQNALARFSTGKVSVLVATDVASRGLDIPNVGLVVNYSMPKSSKDYQHRVGRTARAGRSGLALSLVTPYTIPALKLVELDLDIKCTKVPVPRDQMVELTQEVLQLENQVKKDIKEKKEKEDVLLDRKMRRDRKEAPERNSVPMKRRRTGK